MIAELLAAFFFMTTLSGVFTTWLWRERAINFEQQIHKLITVRLEMGKWLARQIRSACGQYNDDEQPVVLCVAQMRERIAELEARQVPEGWVAVPIDHTRAMEAAAEEYWREAGHFFSPNPRTWAGLYAAMLSAAPEAGK